MSGVSVETRRLVLGRAVHRCERCGRPLSTALGYSLQHRRARGMGGTRRPDTNDPPNLVAACGSATTGCHSWMESHPRAAAQFGWRVAQADDPAAVPIVHWRHGWVWLTSEGTYAKEKP